MARKRLNENDRFPRTTVRRYVDQGFDVLDASGRVDPIKFRQIQQDNRRMGQYGSSRSEEARRADRRYRKAKADKMELEYLQAAGQLVWKDRVVHEWRTRVADLRRLLLDFGQEIAPRVIGRSAREIQAIIDVRTHEILRTFARQEYRPDIDIESPHKAER